MLDSRKFFVTLIAALAITSTAIQADAQRQTLVKPIAPTRFTVVEAGTKGKPDILLIPGLTSSRKVWAAEAERLAPKYRLHLLQINGFGGQPAGVNAADDMLLSDIVEELHGFIAARRMRPVIIGHSLGGLLTLMLAKKYPSDVSKMVIVDALPFYGLMFGPQATVENVRPTAKAMRDGALTQTAAQREAGAKQTADMLALSADGRKVVAADSVSSDPGVFARVMYEDLQTDLRSDLATIKTPTLVLYAFDPTLTFPNGVKPTREMADSITSTAYKMMPSVKLVRVDESRHFIMFDQPDRLHGLIQAFISKPDIA